MTVGGLTAALPRASGARTRFRPDIEALRALAIALVVAYHAGVTFVPGGFVGVDVFFVISGFLITGLLVREIDATGRVRLMRFYARRARRLIPAAVTVLAAVAALAVTLAPGAYRDDYGRDIAAAAGYVANWGFAARAVDYLGSQMSPSPALHFWSLSVEEQFYLVWPVLLAAVAWGIRRRRWRTRPAMAVALGALALPSLAWCLAETGANPDVAFFDTGVRMWELALGGLVAIGAPAWVRLDVRLRGPGALLGLVLIAGAAIGMRADMAWPGALALVPTAGAALVMVAGGAGGASVDSHAWMTGRWWRPVLWLGALSYSLYLWHWPLLVAARQAWGELAPGTAAAAVAAAVVLAWLTHRLIENPVRFAPALVASDRRSILMGAALSLCGVGLGVAVAVSAPDQDASRVAAIDLTSPGEPEVLDLATMDPTAPHGGAALWPDPSARWPLIPASGAVRPVPDPDVAVDDRPQYSDPDCHLIIEFDEVTPRWCVAGDTEASRRIVVVGDSKSIQWYSALDAYGDQHGWRVELTSKASCSFSEATLIIRSRPYETCDAWNRAVVAALEEDPPDVVLTSGIYGVASPLGSSADVTMSLAAGIDGYARRWSRLQADGIRVVALLDNPIPPSDIDECVSRHVADPDACALTRSSSVAGSGGPAMREAAARTPGVAVVDLTDYFCDAASCPAVIDNVVVYRGGFHLTDTYVRTLAPVLAWELSGALGT
ncbi:acyltransferase family protein [Demequina soli]|uniref:acyltransferase family protein n=1 Tax=Demequina soli TaxID=1638987 RepID=UPI0007815423|nr:acyltransferase family protein [Demequina soli]